MNIVTSLENHPVATNAIGVFPVFNSVFGVMEAITAKYALKKLKQNPNLKPEDLEAYNSAEKREVLLANVNAIMKKYTSKYPSAFLSSQKSMPPITTYETQRDYFIKALGPHFVYFMRESSSKTQTSTPINFAENKEEPKTNVLCETDAYQKAALKYLDDNTATHPRNETGNNTKKEFVNAFASKFKTLIQGLKGDEVSRDDFDFILLYLYLDVETTELNSIFQQHVGKGIVRATGIGGLAVPVYDLLVRSRYSGWNVADKWTAEVKKVPSTSRKSSEQTDVTPSQMENSDKPQITLDLEIPPGKEEV